MEGFQKLTKEGLKVAFFSMIEPVMNSPLPDDQKETIVKAIQMSYCSLRVVDDNIAEAFNRVGEDEFDMILTNFIIPEPEDLKKMMRGEE